MARGTLADAVRAGLMAAAVLAPAAVAAAQVGTPPPFLCGRAYSFGTAGSMTALSGVASNLPLQTLHFMNQIGSSCPPGPYNVTITARLDCAGGQGTPVNFGPFAIAEGAYTQLPITVAVPAGPARTCMLNLTARLTVPNEGAIYEQTAEYHVFVVDPASPTPPISIDFSGPAISRRHPGDPGSVMLTLTNNTASDTISGTLTATSRNYADQPAVVAGPNDSRRGPYAPSDPARDAPPINLGSVRPISDLCDTLPKSPPPNSETRDSRLITLAPGQSTTVMAASRWGDYSAHGAAADVCFHFESNSRVADIHASANAIFACDTAQAPAFPCPGAGRAATGFASTVSGVGPAAGILGSPLQDNSQQFRVNLTLNIAGFQMLINGVPISSGNPNFSGVTQTDGQHVRLTSEYSFITPLAPPDSKVTMIVPIDVLIHPASAGQYQAALRNVETLADAPTGMFFMYPSATGAVDVNSTGSMLDAMFGFVHQMNAVGVESGTFNPREMTLTDLTLTPVSPSRYVATSTWTATNPGTTPFVGFDVFNDFRAVAKRGDFDGDCIPNELDPCEHVYNRFPDPPSCGTVAVDQVDFLDTDGTPTAVNSDYGQFTADIPNPGASPLFVNAEIGGMWEVRNMPVTGIDFPVNRAFQNFSVMYRIGPRGDDVSGQVRAVRTSVTTEPLPFGVPMKVAPTNVTIGTFVQQVGRSDSEGSPPPPGAEGPADFPRPESRDFIEVARRPGFKILDLFLPGEDSSCSPASVANSMFWLNRTYCLGLPEQPDDQDTLRGLMNELARRAGTTIADGTTSRNMRRAKEAFIRVHQLPLKFEAQGTVTEPISPVSLDDLFKQMKLGQDVEIGYEHGTGADVQGHAVALVEMRKEGSTYTITTIDDPRQTIRNAPDPMTGEPRDRRQVYEIRLEGGFVRLRNGGEADRFRWWMAESPSRAAVNRAICMKAQDLQMFADSLGNSADATQAAELRRRAQHAEFLGRALLEHVRCEPDHTPEQRRAAEEVLFAAFDVEEASERVQRRVDFPGQVFELEELRDALRSLLMRCTEFPGFYPPDADFDDIPDNMDNAPMVPNPDQADCNNNGIGDVIEIMTNDCNDNGIPDDCDIRDGTSMDANGDGRPDECPCPADFNQDGAVNSQDFFDFLNALFALDPSADFNRDGTVNSQDFFDFLNALFRGC